MELELQVEECRRRLAAPQAASYDDYRAYARRNAGLTSPQRNLLHFFD